MTTFNNPMSASIIALLFFVSTMFGLMHYWNEAENIQDSISMPTEEAGNIVSNQDKGLFESVITGIFTSGFFDFILNVISWLSPFGLVKLVIFAFTTNSPELYTFIDYFLLRPMGWVMFFVQFEWMAFLLRGKGN